MTSTCPSCFAEVNHEDHLFEVACQCGMHFNPYYSENQNSDLGQLSAIKETSKAADEIYQESSKTFAELREFGEALGQGQEPEIVPPKKVESTSSGAMPPMLMTSGDHLEGWTIQQYHSPLSLCTEVGAHDNPLQLGFQKLWQKATQGGATAVVALRWQLSSDQSRVFLSGTPVTTSKK